MRRVPWWAVLSAACAPVFLIGGWTLAAARQPGGFNPVTDTISALAARGAADRWVMTAGLAGLGGCHIATALGLRPAALAGRVALAAGGVATLLVAAFPQPARGSSTAHVWAAATGFVTLALWPAFAARYERRWLWPRPVAGLATAILLLAIVIWFAVEFIGKGGLIGLSERFAAGSQAFCPLAVVLLVRRHLAQS